MPIFVYFFAWLAYVCLGGLGLVLCFAYMLSPSHRQIAKQLAGGIIGSFPGVFIFQVMSVPLILAAVFLILGFNQVAGELDEMSHTIFAGFFLLSTIGLFAGASITGFLVGWRVGYRIACGESLGAALKASRVLGYPLRFSDRLRKKNIV